MHWSCGPWALTGECDANPNYMVGHEARRLPSHCARACGRCPAFDALQGIPLEVQPALRQLQEHYAQQFQQIACHATCSALFRLMLRHSLVLAARLWRTVCALDAKW